jgi:hypothetical protein
VRAATTLPRRPARQAWRSCEAAMAAACLHALVPAFAAPWGATRGWGKLCRF